MNTVEQRSHTLKDEADTVASEMQALFPQFEPNDKLLRSIFKLCYLQGYQKGLERSRMIEKGHDPQP